MEYRTSLAEIDMPDKSFFVPQYCGATGSLIKNKKASAKNFSRSDCIEITDINMPKLSSRIGCNDSPLSLVNQQTESMTEKFFKESFWILL